MNTQKTTLLAVLFLAASVFSIFAQQRAVTDKGVEVILFDDGTWEYAEWENPPGLAIDDAGSGKSAEIIIENELMFTLTNGLLTDFRVFHQGTRLYDNMSGKLRKIGPYEIKYQFASDKLEQVGPYKIRYDFSTDRVTQIGEYRIEYDFHSDKISRIGNTRFEYSFFNGKLTDVRGNTPGVRISIY